MPRHAKGPRLARHVNKMWCIRDDNGVFKSTGLETAEKLKRRSRSTSPRKTDQVGQLHRNK